MPGTVGFVRSSVDDVYANRLRDVGTRGKTPLETSPRLSPLAE